MINKKIILNIAKNIRIKILELSNKAKSSHVGSSLSAVEILLVLYKFFIKKKNIFILSKGHAGAGLYAGLSEIGIVKKKKSSESL